MSSRFSFRITYTQPVLVCRINGDFTQLPAFNGDIRQIKTVRHQITDNLRRAAWCCQNSGLGQHFAVVNGKSVTHALITQPDQCVHAL